MEKAFKIEKKGMTKGKITILKGNNFNMQKKINFYSYLGYKVYDLNNNRIK